MDAGQSRSGVSPLSPRPKAARCRFYLDPRLCSGNSRIAPPSAQTRTSQIEVGRAGAGYQTSFPPDPELGSPEVGLLCLALSHSRNERTPMDSASHTSSLLATFLDPYATVEVTEANLPHWRQGDVTYFVTFRLADSLPQAKLTQWLTERAMWLARHPPPLSREDQRAYYERFPGALQAWLDQGSGSCVLRLPECRQIVATALRHFSGARYFLGTYVVAPNHVHALVTPLGGYRLSDILHSWKSFTAKTIRGVGAASDLLVPWWDSLHARRIATTAPGAVGRSPHVLYRRPVWQKESYDHIVRSSGSLRRIEEYIRGHSAWEQGDSRPEHPDR